MQQLYASIILLVLLYSIIPGISQKKCTLSDPPTSTGSCIFSTEAPLVRTTSVRPGVPFHLWFPCHHHNQQDARTRTQEPIQGRHQDGVAALLAPVCCVVSSDPAIATESERSFLTFVLADRHLRAHLLPEAGMQLGASDYADYASIYSGAVGPIGINHDRSLSGILERLREARPSPALPGGEERRLPRVGPECASQVRTSNNICTDTHGGE